MFKFLFLVAIIRIKIKAIRILIAHLFKKIFIKLYYHDIQHKKKHKR